VFKVELTFEAALLLESEVVPKALLALVLASFLTAIHYKMVLLTQNRQLELALR